MAVAGLYVRVCLFNSLLYIRTDMISVLLYNEIKSVLLLNDVELLNKQTENLFVYNKQTSSYIECTFLYLIKHFGNI